MKEKNPLENVSPRTYVRRKLVFQITLIVCIVGFCLLSVLAKYYSYLFFDPFVTNFVQNINVYGFDTLMRFLSLIGNPPINFFLTVAIAIPLFLIGKKKDGAIVLVSVVGTTLLSLLLKIAISRPRPDPSMIQLRIPFEESMSFPSGHVLFYVGLFGMLLFLAYTGLKLSPLRYFLSSIFLTLIILIGFSRIYLGVHWFSDVLASYFIGFIWIFVVVSMYRRFN